MNNYTTRSFILLDTYSIGDSAHKKMRTSGERDMSFILVITTSNVAPLSSPIVCTSSTNTKATVPT